MEVQGRPTSWRPGLPVKAPVALFSAQDVWLFPFLDSSLGLEHLADCHQLQE